MRTDIPLGENEQIELLSKISEIIYGWMVKSGLNSGISYCQVCTMVKKHIV